MIWTYIDKRFVEKKHNIFVGKALITTRLLILKLYYICNHVYGIGKFEQKGLKVIFKTIKKILKSLVLQLIISCRVTRTFSLKYWTLMYLCTIYIREESNANTYCPWLQCQIYGMWLYCFARTLYKEICFVAFNLWRKYQTFDLILEIHLSLDAQITLITYISMIDMELK